MTIYKDRPTCYRCFRPLCSCICQEVSAVETQSCFVILMHQKEFAKTKNNTGRMTHLSLPNSHLFVGIDFSRHDALNALLKDPKYTPYLLFPDETAINLSQERLTLQEGTVPLFILIDSTWACAKSLMLKSKNLYDIPRVSFNATKLSNYQIKKQPENFCLSTIETTQTILELLTQQGLERLKDHSIKAFTKPFEAMVNYQILKAQNENELRFKPSGKS